MTVSKVPRHLADVDQVRAFMTYAHFNGDANRAALALGLPSDDVETLAALYGWAGRLKSARGSGSSEGAARSLNRAINFVQAHRIRGMVDQLIQEFSSSPEKLVAMVTVQSMQKNYIDTGPFLNLVRAAQVAHEMTYRASGDSLQASGQVEGGDTPQDSKAAASAVLSVLAAIDSTPGKSSVDFVRQEIAKEDRAALSATTD